VGGFWAKPDVLVRSTAIKMRHFIKETVEKLSHVARKGCGRDGKARARSMSVPRSRDDE